MHKSIQDKSGYLPLDIIFSKNILKANKYELREAIKVNGRTVPKGFVSDGATVPRWLTVLGVLLLITSLIFELIIPSIVSALVSIIPVIFPKDGRYMAAALLHDYLLESGADRWLCDSEFKYGLMSLDVPRWRVSMMYYAVRGYSLLKAP